MTENRNLISRGLAMQERARNLIPGMSQLLSKRPDMFSFGVWPGYYSSARGARIRDLDGNEFLDMSIGGIGATVLGYADPDVDEAVCRAVRDGVATSLNCPEEVELAERLCALHPWAEMARFTRSGGEAMAVAVRIARAATGRDVVAFCGYHGWHDWYLAANLGTENALGEHLIAGLSPAGVPSGLAGTALPFRYNRPDELRSIVGSHGDRLAAVIMEPIRGEQPKPGFLEEVRTLADRAGAVLIFDEISAGLRLGTGGAHLRLTRIEPDMAVFSKALGNGYAVAAVIGKRGCMEAAQSTFISSTNWTERIGPVAALATLAKHEREDAAGHLCRMGLAVQEAWVRSAATHGLAIKAGGIPPLSHFSFTEGDPLVRKALFVQGMLGQGILASTLFYAMLAHTDEDVARYAEALDGTFAAIASAARQGREAELLQGESAVSGFRRLA